MVSMGEGSMVCSRLSPRVRSDSPMPCSVETVEVVCCSSCRRSTSSAVKWLASTMSCTVGTRPRSWPEPVRDAVELHQVPRHLLRQADLAAVLGQGVEDGLAHPPGGVGEELVLALRVEALGRLDQPQVAFGDQVEQVQAHALELARLLHHEAQVALHQHAQALGIAVAAARGGR